MQRREPLFEHICKKDELTWVLNLRAGTALRTTFFISRIEQNFKKNDKDCGELFLWEILQNVHIKTGKN